MSGLWSLILKALHAAERNRAGKDPQPTAAIMDSQSVKTTEESAHPSGYDAHKNLKGRKRHVRGSEIHSEGGGAGFSFGNRETPDPFASGAAPGERWVWYSTGRTARLWTLGDKMAVTPAGEVTIQGTITQGSDARMKANIAKLTDVLGRLEAINGVSFERIGSHTLSVRSAQQRDIGVIAQEVEAVFPELVSTHGHENHKAVNYSGLTGVLIEAVKELRVQNEALGSRIEALERA